MPMKIQQSVGVHRIVTARRILANVNIPSLQNGAPDMLAEKFARIVLQ
jgi:hypothetical protein